MNESAHQSFTNLEVWQKARIFKNDIKEISKTFPPEEKFRLVDQIIKSSRGINATIAGRPWQVYIQRSASFLYYGAWFFK